MLAALKVADLRVEYAEAGKKTLYALNGISLEILPGEVLGLVGESGSGKSTLAKSLVRLLPANAQVKTGKIEFEQQNLLDLSEPQLEKIRGARISMVPQDPASSLSPVRKIGDQIADVFYAHRQWPWKDCQREAKALLGRMLLGENGRRFYDAYPHQLSGGQQQRVAIAQALACRPVLVVADEPTSFLDSETEAEILAILRDLKKEHRTSLLLITHNPKILIGLADRVAVMYGGRIVEQGNLVRVFSNPRHPYTKALLDCLPPETGVVRMDVGERFPSIEGNAPDPETAITGCKFADRCNDRLHHCDSRVPAAFETESAHSVECFLYGN